MKVTLAAALLLASVSGALATPRPSHQGEVFLEKVIHNDLDAYLHGPANSMFVFDGYEGLDVPSAYALTDAAIGVWFASGKTPSFIKTDKQKRNISSFTLLGPPCQPSRRASSATLTGRNAATSSLTRRSYRNLPIELPMQPTRSG